MLYSSCFSMRNYCIIFAEAFRKWQKFFTYLTIRPKKSLPGILLKSGEMLPHFSTLIGISYVSTVHCTIQINRNCLYRRSLKYSKGQMGKLQVNFLLYRPWTACKKMCGLCLFLSFYFHCFWCCCSCCCCCWLLKLLMKLLLLYNICRVTGFEPDCTQVCYQWASLTPAC